MILAFMMIKNGGIDAYYVDEPIFAGEIHFNVKLLVISSWIIGNYELILLFIDILIIYSTILALILPY